MLCVDENGRVCQDRYQQIASQLFGLGKSKKTKRRNAANEAAARASGFNSFKEALQARKAAGQWVQGPNASAAAVEQMSPTTPAPGAALVPAPQTSLSPTTGPGVVNTLPAAPPGSSPLPMMPTPSAGGPSSSDGPPSAVDASYGDSQAQADARSEMDQAARNEDANPGEMPEEPRRHGRRGMRTVTADEMMRADDVDESGYGMDVQEGMGTYIFTGPSPRTMTVTQYERSWADAFKGTLDYLPWGETQPFGGARRIEHRKRAVYSPEEQMAREAVNVENATEKDPFGLGRFKPRPPGAPPGRRKKHHGKKKSRGHLPGNLRLSIQLKENNLPFDSSRLSGIRGAGDGYSLVTPRDGSENLGSDASMVQTGIEYAAGGIAMTYLSSILPGSLSGLMKIFGVGAIVYGVMEFLKPSTSEASQSSTIFPPDQSADDVKIAGGFAEPARGGQAELAAMLGAYRVVCTITNRGDKVIPVLEATISVDEYSKLLFGFIPMGSKVTSARSYTVESLQPGETRTIVDPKFPRGGDVVDSIVHRDAVASLLVKKTGDSAPVLVASTSYTI